MFEPRWPLRRRLDFFVLKVESSSSSVHFSQTGKVSGVGHVPGKESNVTSKGPRTHLRARTARGLTTVTEDDNLDPSGLGAVSTAPA